MAPYGGKRSSGDEAARELNVNKKKRASRDEDYTRDGVTEFRLLCPAAKVGGIIGKGGATISALRRECNCHISVEELVPGSEERVVRIYSTSKKDENTESVCPAQEALRRVHAKIVAESVGSDGEEPAQVTARLLVPHEQVGCILGKGGKVIEQMRKDIPIQIRILPKEQTPTCASSSEELLQLVGDPILVEKGLKTVSTRLYENPPREHHQNNSKQHEELLAMTGGSRTYSGVPFLGHLSVAGDAMSGLGSYPYSSLGGIGSRPLASGIPAKGTEEVITLRILCPLERAGRVIGKGGSVVQKMQDESHAKIAVKDAVAGCEERVIEITSTEVMESYTSSGIEAALLVYQCLADWQKERESDNSTVTVRMLVPSSDVGCLLGKGGQVIMEMRKATGANIRIPTKEVLPACADGSVDQLVQIIGDEYVVQEALLQVLNRLRANVFKGHSGPMHTISRKAYVGTNPVPFSYGGRPDSWSGGFSYPLTEVGRPFEYASYGGALPVSFATDAKEYARLKY